MPRLLAFDVHLPLTPADPFATRFRAGTRESALPAGVASRIVNPAAWVEEVVEEVVEVEIVEDLVDPELTGELDEDGDVTPPEPGATPTAPPRGGAGSGGAAWLAFAQSLGQVVPDGASRDEIVAQLEAGGFIEAEED